MIFTRAFELVVLVQCIHPQVLDDTVTPRNVQGPITLDKSFYAFCHCASLSSPVKFSHPVEERTHSLFLFPKIDNPREIQNQFLDRRDGQLWKYEFLKLR